MRGRVGFWTVHAWSDAPHRASGVQFCTFERVVYSFLRFLWFGKIVFSSILYALSLSGVNMYVRVSHYSIADLFINQSIQTQ